MLTSENAARGGAKAAELRGFRDRSQTAREHDRALTQGLDHTAAASTPGQKGKGAGRRAVRVTTLEARWWSSDPLFVADRAVEPVTDDGNSCAVVRPTGALTSGNVACVGQGVVTTRGGSVGRAALS